MIVTSSNIKGLCIHKARLQREFSLFFDTVNLPNNRLISIQWISRHRIQYLNHYYRNKNKPTDILSFELDNFSEPDYNINVPSETSRFSNNSDISNSKDDLINNDGNKIPFGEIFLCPTIIQNICERNHVTNMPYQKRVLYLLIHGFCHLLGHDHHIYKDSKLMNQLERQLLSVYYHQNSLKADPPSHVRDWYYFKLPKV